MIIIGRDEHALRQAVALRVIVHNHDVQDPVVLREREPSGPVSSYETVRAMEVSETSSSSE